MSAQAPTLQPNDPVPGTKYRVLRSLGAGGMGIVYQVVKPPNIQGVLKLMSADLTDHADLRTRFFDEVRILAQLDHPNIVKVFDYDALPDGTPFYVMELLSGRTVRDVLTTIGRVPPRVAYEVTRQLLEALQCAHTHEVPVIHRDIKPENIFLHAPKHGEPVVKLIDFGVSAVADRKHDGSFVGTWSYAAPEQIRGEAPTPTTDLYSAALVLYEMLAGRGPFDHYDDWLEISDAQLKEIPAPVSKYAPWVPASIVGLIASALAKDPAARPASAYAFSERLFELEWANDGKAPPDLTTEGPSRSVVSPPKAATPGAGTGSGSSSLPGPGPLSLVLSTVTGANPSSKKMAAAEPARDRLGDVPLIGVPPESVQSGPTWPRAFGLHEPTAPNTNALLAGLGATPRKPASKRERESDPDAGADASPHSPRAGQVVIRAGRLPSSPDQGRDPTTPRALAVAPVAAATDGVTGETLDAPLSSPALRAAAALSGQAPPHAPNRDTFSSQQSDPRAAPRSRFGVLAIAAAGLFVASLAVVLVLALRGRGGSPGGSTMTAMVPDRPPATATGSPSLPESAEAAVAVTTPPPAVSPATPATAPAPGSGSGSASASAPASPSAGPAGPSSTRGSSRPTLRAPATTKPAAATSSRGDYMRGLP